MDCLGMAGSMPGQKPKPCAWKSMRGVDEQLVQKVNA